MVDHPHDQELEDEDAECALVAKAPRVELQHIRDAIAEVHYSRASTIFAGDGNIPMAHPLHVMTLCALVMNNGFVLIGKSAPASARNFDPELGKRLAHRDAIRQAWPFLGFKLREDLYRHGLHDLPPLELEGSTGPAKPV